MNKKVKLLIFSLITVIILSVTAPIQNVKFLNVDAVSAATNGGNTSTQAQTTTNKPTTTSATSKTFKGITRFLALHSYGEDVKLLQTLLNQHGYKLKVDGIFGPKTLAAVKDFQKKNGLKVDGIVGPKTLAKLNPAPTQTAASKPAEQPAVQSEKVAVKIGKVVYAAHGTKCFTIASAAVLGDKIVAAYIDDYQFLPKDVATGVPNSDQEFGKNYPEGYVLASKLTNAEYYSNNMKIKAGSTVPINQNFAAIVNYVKGKTISELESELAHKTKEEMVDAVTGATLQDTYGYITAIVEAAKVAK
ncbi:MAG: peptidoglycan-binding domain-containing protein [Thermovenabulum sp.]|uniref:peptidoglycan-binding domain-containing protein n=1 Tax=Thermovenabulum sp. TaxID=3100335 RepID=UPI003C7CFC1D